MVQKLGISIPTWLYREIEQKRGSLNRSEFIAEKVIKGLKVEP